MITTSDRIERITRVLLLLTLLPMSMEFRAGDGTPPLPPAPGQGVVDLLLEYMEIRYPGQDLHQDVLYVSIHRQQLFHVRDRQVVAIYPVATATNGPGTLLNSYRTPTGLHRVVSKHGDGVPPFGILQEREFTGELADPDFAGIDEDWITSRILRLDGMEPGINQGGLRDSHERCIYIHGTANEGSIGTPSSNGCIRMRNADVIALYAQVHVGALVVVLDN